MLHKQRIKRKKSDSNKRALLSFCVIFVKETAVQKSSVPKELMPWTNLI